MFDALGDKGVIEVLRGEKPFRFLIEIDTLSFVKIIAVLILSAFLIKLSLGLVSRK